MLVALIVLLLLLAIFGGLGFVLHVLWFVLIGLLILWLIGWFVGAGSSAFASGRRRWYRW
ncbi:MAG: hydrophobic protein [Solirubrobacterales bacterium]|nr:hydrophobic protein [Solirubrobacterales bacterium]